MKYALISLMLLANSEIVSLLCLCILMCMAGVDLMKVRAER